jgi:hypothetical protein
MILELLSYVIVAVVFGLYYYFKGFRDGKEETEKYLNSEDLKGGIENG